MTRTINSDGTKTWDQTKDYSHSQPTPAQTSTVNQLMNEIAMLQETLKAIEATKPNKKVEAIITKARLFYKK